MGFLEPLNLLFALSIAVLILIYLRSRVRSTVDVSSLMLFEEIQASVSKIRVLRLDLLFWLEAAALAGLVLAVAGLYLKMTPAPGAHRRRALVFDLAASMGAREGRQTRLDQAKAQALRLISAAFPGERFAVVGFAKQAEVERYFTADLRSVRDAIKALHSYDVAAAPAALSAALMRVREADEVELFAPQLPAGAGPLDQLSGPKLRFHQIGRDDDNAAIVALDTGIPRSTPGRCTVRNLSANLLIAQTEIYLDGRRIGRAPLILPPHDQANFSFGPLPAGGIVQARILNQDALEADNQRYAYAPTGRPLKAIVISPDATVRDDLARVLRAIDPASVVVAIPAKQLTPGLLDKPLGNGSVPDIAILHDSNDAAVNAPAKLLIFPPTASELQIKATLPVSQMDDRSELGPLTRPLLLGPTRDISLPQWMDPVAHGTAPRSAAILPLAAVGSDARGRLGVIAFDIRGHRLLDPDMLDILVLTIDLVKGLTAARDIQVVQTGSYVTIPATSAARIVEPDGSTLQLSPGYGNLIRFCPLYAGRYEIHVGKSRQLVFANYFDAAESQLSVKAGGESGTPLASTLNLEPVLPPRRVQPVGLLLVILALTLMLVESALLVRRAIRGGMNLV